MSKIGRIYENCKQEKLEADWAQVLPAAAIIIVDCNSICSSCSTLWLILMGSRSPGN